MRLKVLQTQVSILVLLELSLKLISITSKNAFDGSFNPCSIGTISKARTGYCLSKWLNAVSILVLLELSLKRFKVRMDRLCRLVSILVLLELSLKHYLIQVVLSFSLGFNPCSIGTISKALLELKWSSKKERFQSLFYWNYL